MEDDILFESRFSFDKDAICSDFDIKYILNILLNSRELTNTELKISDGFNKSVLLGLRVKKIDYNSFYLSGLYYVTDGIKTENRDLCGTLKSNGKEVILLLNITRYSSVVDIVELGEIFRFNSKSVKRFSTYSSYKGSSTCISISDFDKFSTFKDESVKCLKRGYFNG